MIKFGLLVKLEAKPGKEEEVVNFLESGLALVKEEQDTITWYGIKLGPSTFGIFDTFPHEEGRKAHLAGEVAKALMANAPDLLAAEPEIIPVEVLAVK
ncbi:putative quinol monooxygenase [Mucilaginibacter ginsenosidivorax]|uniref:Antibiotic biosynthesis monooxygenase n=1 Tax=Mucilaginibacter ginsenosidivorax TaxID=862126 RepID=A0A5B8W476_9SPHI|nr:antibiotic biosynthesis monooxygenase [Mucilaginibacter ginsenosidivorax]QEC78533.1 antibiotic biosynthesis monooxygenase [Mucilaginibacter ginsenosidivorax]